MINRWTTGLRLLWGQERAYLLPVLISEGWDPLQGQGRREDCRHRRGLPCATEPMEVLCSPLMLAPKVRPVQAVGLLLL